MRHRRPQTSNTSSNKKAENP
uniref:Uncharacterized protein n=1 Tax=Rhizophora mucronata TaxID=61149 RepID=A0A2P2QZ61_RHIMU